MEIGFDVDVELEIVDGELDLGGGLAFTLDGVSSLDDVFRLLLDFCHHLAHLCQDVLYFLFVLEKEGEIAGMQI